LEEAPSHPGAAYYLIQAADNPNLAALGLPAARRYAQIAPAVPHTLHMPSHIFARLGLWQEAHSIKPSIAGSGQAGFDDVNGLYGAGRAAELALQPEKAAGFYAQLLKNCENQASSPRPEIVRARAFLAGRNAPPRN